MNRQRPTIVALVLATALAAGAAHAHARSDVQWSVTIGAPAVVLPRIVLPAPPLPPVYVQHGAPQHRGAYRAPTRWDVDGDGIPNRYDRVYNPRWDRDGDGIPNRHDRVHNPRWDVDGDGIPNRYDRRHEAPRPGRYDHDHHDRDGRPDRRDPYPYPPQGGRGR
jgi:hypothetical protein